MLTKPILYLRMGPQAVSMLTATIPLRCPQFLGSSTEEKVTRIISEIEPSSPAGQQDHDCEQQADESSGLVTGASATSSRIQDHYRAILEGQKPTIDSQEGKTAVDMVLAMYRIIQPPGSNPIPLCTRYTLLSRAQGMRCSG